MVDLRLHSPFLTVYFFWHSLHSPGFLHFLQCLSQIAVEKKGEHGIQKCNAYIQSSSWYKINNRFHPGLSDQHIDILIAIILTKFISHTCPNTDESNCSLVGTIISVLELKWEIVIQMLLLICKSTPGNAF